MKSNCYFEECKNCMYKEYNDDLIGCLSNRLGLAFYQLFKEIPIANKFINDYRYCHWFQKEEE